MTARVVKSTLALHDVAGIAGYIAEKSGSEETAERFVCDLDEKMASHARQSLIGDLREDLGEGIRCFPFKRNYVVIYRPLEDGIDVLRVFQGAP